MHDQTIHDHADRSTRSAAPLAITLSSAALIGGALLAGCGGAQISPQLASARETVRDARGSSAASLKPEGLMAAQRELEIAEKASDGSIEEAHHAYLAEREALVAMADARATELEQAAARDRARHRAELAEIVRSRGEALEARERTIEEQAAAIQEQRAAIQEQRVMLEQQRAAVQEQQRRLDQSEQALASQRALAESRGESLEEYESTLAEQRAAIQEQRATLEEHQQALAQAEQSIAAQHEALSESERMLQEQRDAIAQREEQLSSEREARMEAEQRAEAAMDRLRELAAVREEGGETIITLSGAVLFETDRAEVRERAHDRLVALADALRASEGQLAVIEGHTDSRGSDEYNMRLSQQRAEAVRDYLVGEGVPIARLRAVGRGEQEPIASNDTPDGRAENRRVEVHLRPLAVMPERSSEEMPQRTPEPMPESESEPSR